MSHVLAAVAAAAVIAAALSAPAAAQDRTGDQKKFKAVAVKTPDGLTIATQEWGNAAGPGIVFVRGFSQAGMSWIRQVTDPAMAAEFHVVTYDLRGHGNSDKPLEPECYRDGKAWADELQAVIDATGLKRPVVVGWSYGGRIMADYIGTYGTALKYLSLMASEDLAVNIAACRQAPCRGGGRRSLRGRARCDARR
jgi:non-heme chloroperoxidase